ncbi:MAG TPA: phosphoribosylanthranilate isomerase [Vicinamibacteria bacterium]|nr:phosphoribosylanthranilate isomerase [Vicinamibacteria bacterium]
MKPLVKICGLRRVADAELAVSLGATHVGSVRAPSSPRRASLEEARAIFDAVSGTAERVLVFKDVPLAVIVDEARTSRADAVQLYEHDDEVVRALESEGLRVYRAYRVEPGSAALPEIVPVPSDESPAVLDVGGGGSGRTFDWRLLGERAPHATFLAGGIGPNNVRKLLNHHPYGIDLATGVERAPGVKDEVKLREFFEEVSR